MATATQNEARIDNIENNSVRVQNLSSAQSQAFLQTLWNNQTEIHKLETLNVIFPNRVYLEENGDIRILRSASDEEIITV